MKDNKVWTPDGYQAGPMNSLVGKGESIIDYTNGTGTLVTKGKVGVDDQPSSVHPDDTNVIAGNDVDWIGYYQGKHNKPMTFAQQAAPYTAGVQALNELAKAPKHPELSSLSRQTQKLQETNVNRAKQPLLNSMKEITDRQALTHRLRDQYNLYRAYHGMDLPRFDSGNESTWSMLGRQIPAIAGTGASLAQLVRWGNESPAKPNTYVANQYGRVGLNGLASLRYNPYPQVRAVQNQARQSAYALSQAGGLTGAQRYIGRVANGIGAQSNMANVYANAEQQNNKLRENYYTTALSTGAQDATRRQNANQWDYGQYVAAHGAKIKGMEQSMANLVGQIQNAYQNEFKYDMFNKNLALYQQNNQLDMEKLRADIAQREADRKAQVAQWQAQNELYRQYGLQALQNNNKK